MGGDRGPRVPVEGASLALRERKNSRFIFHGVEAELKPLLEQFPELKAVSEIRNAEVVIAMDEKPSQALRRGRGSSSMWSALQAVKDGQADVAGVEECFQVAVGQPDRLAAELFGAEIRMPGAEVGSLLHRRVGQRPQRERSELGIDVVLATMSHVSNLSHSAERPQVAFRAGVSARMSRPRPGDRYAHHDCRPTWRWNGGWDAASW